MKHKELAGKILELVGKEQNISSVTHCATRLRLVLKDDSKADIKAISAMEGVITAQNKGGQLQVVIGAHVDQVYKEVIEIAHIKGDGAVEDTGASLPKRRENPINAFLATISSIFTPILPALIGCGMMQCLSRIFTATGLFPSDSGFITIFNMIGACIFYFMPFFLAVSAARKFKTNEFMAICLAAAYMHPAILGASEPIIFLGLPIRNVNYSSTVIPIILSVFVLKYVYDFINKIIPDIVKVVMVPMLTLLVLVPVQLIVLGPMGSYIGSGLSNVILAMFNFNGAIAGALLGFFRPILVMFGMHYSIMPMQVQQVAELGFTVMIPSALCANLAQAGAAFGVMLKTKNAAMKTAAGSASVTALFGITEPAIYGVTLRYKRPFFCACTAAAITAGFLGMVNGRANAIALPGILSLGVYEADNYFYVIIAAALAFVLGTAFTYFAGLDTSVEN